MPTTFLLDGATNTDPTFNTQNFSPSPDAVREFQVQASSYSGDMGSGGGQINIVTRSSFAPNTVFPDGITVASLAQPVSTANMLENTAQSWYNAGYANLRHRLSLGLSLLAN